MKNSNEDWSNAKKQLLRNWPSLMPEELERTKGDRASIEELLQTKYGLPPPEAHAELLEIMPHIGNTLKLPESEKPVILENNEEINKPGNTDEPEYPNQLYKEDLPPEILLSTKE